VEVSRGFSRAGAASAAAKKTKFTEEGGISPTRLKAKSPLAHRGGFFRCHWLAFLDTSDRPSKLLQILMKRFFASCVVVLAVCSSAAFAGDPPASPDAVVANVQDARAADAEAVQEAVQNTNDAATKASILAAYQQRESERAAQAGAASLQAELARQAAAAAQPAAAAQRNTSAE
jgi:hypothetical protein